MIRAYVLISVVPGRDKAVARAVARLKGVKQVSTVAGPFDVVAIVEVGDLKTLGDLVLDKIRRSEDIVDTLTLVEFG
jgi:DNA-binding Lrp family transcriptional regulator